MTVTQRFFWWLGTGIFTLLTVMAVIFYQERMLFSDMAFQTFHILRTGSIQVQSGRFGAAGTQVFPWAAQAVGMPLKGVLLAYSMGHVLYYFGLFVFTHLVLKQWRWAAVIAFTAVLMTSHTFYWLSEAPQGLAFLLVLLAWTDGKTHLKEIRIWQWPLWVAGTVTAFYFHPMVLYAMFFCCGWMVLGAGALQKKLVWVTGMGLFLLTFVVKYKILQLDWYDAMSLSRAEAFGQLWPHWFDIQSNRDFWKWCRSDYYAIPVLYSTNIILLLWRKKWLLSIWCLVFTPAYILLVNVPFHAGDRQFYLENLYLPLGIFAILPFIRTIFPANESTLPRIRWWMTGFVVLAGVRLLHIYHTHDRWTARLNWEKAFLQNHTGPKILTPEKNLPVDLLQFTWGLPYESLLLTSLSGPDSARTIFQYPEMTPQLDSLARQPDLFLGTFKHYKRKELPERYFRLKEVGYKAGH